ncbi:hypothetical protein C2G38_2211769 [Gigaspora rosea]|uniref:Serine-threonine/tyrosine-protein kinase catalytic domain-containing protein n=1 Tax=Gigaspora rosea TaxID=44941 RepID=A0A397UDZ8_9GLOM|nr:hypothetical protein C2G38_2211769 [Gigaspora rosea]
MMNKCLDGEPQNRPTAEELANMLNKFEINLKDEKTNYLNNQLLNFRELPEPITINAGIDFKIIEFLSNASLQRIPFNNLQIFEEI